MSYIPLRVQIVTQRTNCGIILCRTGVNIMRKKTDEHLYIALDYLDFGFEQRFEIPEIMNMWNLGYSVESIAIWLSRRESEISLLLYDRFLLDQLPSRKNGWNGTKRIRREGNLDGITTIRGLERELERSYQKNRIYVI